MQNLLAESKSCAILVSRKANTATLNKTNLKETETMKTKPITTLGALSMLDLPTGKERNAAKPAPKAGKAGITPPQVALPQVPAPAPVQAVAIPNVPAPTPADGAGITPRAPGRPAGARGATATNVVLPPENLKNMLTELPGLVNLQLPSNPIPWSDAERSVFLSAYGGKVEKAPEPLQAMLNAPKGYEKATLAEIAEAGGSAKIEFALIKSYFRRIGELTTAKAQLFDEKEEVRAAAAARLAELESQGSDEAEE